MRLRRHVPEPDPQLGVDETMLLRPNLPIREGARAQTKARMMREFRRVHEARAAMPDAGTRDGVASEVHAARVEHPTGTMFMSNVEALDADEAAEAADSIAALRAERAEDSPR